MGESPWAFSLLVGRCFTIIIIVIIIIRLANFSKQRYLVVFPWTLSGSKFPQVTSTLSNLTHLSTNSGRDSHDSFLWFQLLPILFLCLRGQFEARHLQLVLMSPSCSTFCFTSLARSKYSFNFLFSLCGLQERQNPLDGTFFCFFN